MRIAFDSSALAKRYIDERGTAQVLELCSQATEVIVSVLCVPEILSGLNRLRREGQISPKGYLLAKEELIADMTQATIVQIAPMVVARSIEVLEKTPLRALDAIHVAVAMDAECGLFVSADAQQCKAAAELGLNVKRIA